MSASYERYATIRDSRGLTDYAVAKRAGIGKSTFSDWKKGRSQPKSEKLMKIAEALETTIENLIGNSSTTYYENDDTAAIAQEILENRELRVLFDAARDASPEDLQTTYEMLMALKRKEMGDSNDPA